MPLSCAKHLHTYYDRPDKAHPALSEPSPAISGGDPETRPDRPRKVHKAGPRPSQTFCGTFSVSEVPSSSTYTTTREGPENRPDRPRKAQKADPRNKASQTFCGTFSGTLLNVTWLCTKASQTFSGPFGTFSGTSLNLTRLLHQCTPELFWAEEFIRLCCWEKLNTNNASTEEI